MALSPQPTAAARTSFTDTTASSPTDSRYNVADAYKGTDSGMRKLDQALRVGQEAEGTDLAGITLPVDRNALSMAMGRDNVVHIAITDSRAAARLRGAIGRLESYLGCATEAPAHGEPASADAPGVG